MDMKNTNSKSRFNLLKTKLNAAPLAKNELEELLSLAKQFDKKMASYIESHRNELSIG